MPQIIYNMGYTATTAQLLTAPPYLMGAFAAIVVSHFSDRGKKRSPYIVGPQVVLVVAYSVLVAKAADFASNVALCYVMVVIACMAVYPIVPGVSAWTINNLAGPEKRNMGSGYLITLGNCGGLIGSFIFFQHESPNYPTGFGTSLAFGAGGIVAVLLVSYLYYRHNRKYEHVSTEEVRAQYSEQQLERMGDSSPLFKYTL
ncbi:hypothetical protein FE257_007845 [Aspergillus nanangensis]|uniref:Major facilitator superfamily (MFS) profile domain-containing protein n=1 Tax=Aspergillus nanangensis TaxID=2582783 RepID=A0AAD4GYT0_ASPNN|nr:hypothetical protein FE257_007845 [Aspergillus nanangensis]